MAKFISTTFGSISGKHGTAVAVTTKDGKTYLRLHRVPTNPNSEKQQIQRAKFGFSNKVLNPFNSLFRETFGFSKGANMGRSYAFRNAIVGEFPEFSLDYEKLKFSFGNVNQALNISIDVTDTTAELNWDFVEAVNSKADDSLNLIFFNEETQLSLHCKDVAMRAELHTEYQLPDAWKDSAVYCWVYFRSQSSSGFSSSESQFVAKVEL